MSVQLSRRNLIGAATVSAAAASIIRPSRALAFVDPPARPIFGPAADIALLSRNENPYGPAPSAISAMADAASKGCYYAEGGYQRLTDMIAERFGVDKTQVVIGNGSTEVLNAAMLAFMARGSVLAPSLFWDTTVKYGLSKGGTMKAVPLADDMSIDLAAMRAADGPDVGLIHICNPNNPTGMVLDGDQLRAFIRAMPSSKPILVDEAYNELTDRPDYSSVSALVKDHPNLIICRTFSKIYGMAGLRVGYAITSPEYAEVIRGYLMGFGGNTMGLAAAIASYNDTGFMTFSKNKVTEARAILLDAVHRAGLTALPSQTNFLFVRVPDADRMRAAMAEREIMIRGAYGPWSQWSRVSTGKIEDVQRYASALVEIMHA